MPTIDTDTEAGKAELQKIIDQATEGLAKKRDELLGDQRKLKDDMKVLKDQIDEINAAKQKAEEEAAAKKGDVDTIRQNYEKKLKALEDDKIALNGKLNSILIDGGLTDALAKANVSPVHMDLVKAYIKTSHKAEVIEKDGAPVAMIGDKPVSDFVKDWSQSDQGKHYVAAPNNGGGGANGSEGEGKAGAKTLPRADFNKLSPADQMKHVKEGGKLTD